MYDNINIQQNVSSVVWDMPNCGKMVCMQLEGFETFYSERGPKLINLHNHIIPLNKNKLITILRHTNGL